jgi:hypothetical protein
VYINFKTSTYRAEAIRRYTSERYQRARFSEYFIIIFFRLPRSPRVIYFDRDISYNVYLCAHVQYNIHVLGILYDVRRTELIIYVHRLHVRYRFNYCYYVVINYHSVGSLRMVRRMAVLQACTTIQLQA